MLSWDKKQLVNEKKNKKLFIAGNLHVTEINVPQPSLFAVGTGTEELFQILT